MFVKPTRTATKWSAQVSVRKSVSTAIVVPLTSQPDGAQLICLVRRGEIFCNIVCVFKFTNAIL